MEKLYLTYEEFGAIGDGKHNDFPAIVACHDEANKKGLAVKANNDSTYYIAGNNLTAKIKTDVDFGTAKFIIDDTSVENRNAHVFNVCSDDAIIELEIKAPLSKGTKKLENPYGKDLFVNIINANDKKFIRKGLNMNNGSDTCDCFILDKDGNIIPALNWDYPEITKISARFCDDKPITITGGIFTTIANQAESFYTYYARGFSIQRSNVHITGVTHYVEGEKDHGAPYAGFFVIDNSYNVILENCLLTPHYIYWTPSKIPGKDVPMGSYDINVSTSVNLTFRNIKQTIDINDSRYWGIYGSNFTKNITMEDCVISRYDAHQGVHNLTIRRCKFGHQRLNLIGFGEALIEDTECMCGNSFVSLRSDYGSVWFGNITIKNCSWHPTGRNLSLIQGYNPADHDFGYLSKMPTEVTVEGFKIYNGNSDEPVYVLNQYDENFEEGKPFPYITTEKVSTTGIELERGELLLCKDKNLYKNTVHIKK